MTDITAPSLLESLSLDELRRFLVASGFVNCGSWGRYLQRYNSEHGQDSFDVLLPVTRDIADYEVRIRDALRDIAAATSLSQPELLSHVQATNYRAFRIRARPGSDINSIPFHEGLGVLEAASP